MQNHTMRFAILSIMKRGRILSLACCIVTTAIFSLPYGAAAATPPSNFDLQITPSPLVATIDPGTQTQLSIKMYNTGTDTENLRIDARSFSFNSNNGQVSLNDSSSAPAIAPFIHFSAQTFSIQAGQWLTENININLPKSAGFSYSFALVISPQSQQSVSSGRSIKGSLADFALINVNRPGATSNLKVVSFTSMKQIYQYLPATLSVRLKNIGNTIVQPYGNIFIGRSSNAKHPIATLPVNSEKEYILPGTARTVTTQWNDGFASYQTTQSPSGNSAQHLVLNWSKLSEFRIGKYTAQLVAVYNDGTYDVPIEGSVSFWVIPWLPIIVLVIILIALWYAAHWLGKRRTDKAVKRALAAADTARKKSQLPSPDKE
jgi:hypothetical protein